MSDRNDPCDDVLEHYVAEKESFARISENLLFNWLVPEFKKKYGVEMRRKLVTYNALKKQAEQAKYELSMLEKKQFTISVPVLLDEPGEPKNLEVIITKEVFDKVSDPDFESLISLKKHLKEFPQAKPFLLKQKRLWDEFSERSWYKALDYNGYFEHATKILVATEGINPKQYHIISTMLDIHNRVMNTLTGALLANTLAEIEHQKQHKVNPKKINWIELPSHYLEFTANDDKMLGHIVKRYEVAWHYQAGLVRYMVSPVDGEDNNNFYKNISDYCLCMKDGLSKFKEEIIQMRKTRIN
ncbi:MAG: Hsp70 family protein [Nanoarchaeota archaeon]|nr:Hsp70 family protein [Nanoarchaeota archaeon]MBU1320792.1 Hsp70 family protein [Nanoarchaeota archaeon]MBU1598297.1 Hsp70 family protein [Nanoarchaeota archaeon]MBU2442261.1 Hsp70 family protein [Nanoarchaeota archaeon]